jgi:hypothetical protein
MIIINIQGEHRHLLSASNRTAASAITIPDCVRTWSRHPRPSSISRNGKDQRAALLLANSPALTTTDKSH